MRATWEELSSKLGYLGEFLESRGNAGPPQGISSPSVQNSAMRRRIDTVGFIASLYAAFEQFIEDLIWSYAEDLTEVMKYEDLPLDLREKHLRTSGALLQNGRLGEGRYSGRSDKDFVTNLYGCMAARGRYRMNRDAVVYHEDNFRAASVQSVFALVGIKSINDRAGATAPFEKWYSDINRPVGSPEETIRGKTIAARLENFVQHRNQFVHGGGRWDDSLGPSELQPHLEFVRAYCEALFRVVVGEYLRRRYIENPKLSSALEIIKGPFDKANHAVVVSKPSSRVSREQPIIGLRQDRVDFWGYVKGLRIDNREVKRFDVRSQGTTFSLVADFVPTKNTRLYVIKVKDSKVWA